MAEKTVEGSPLDEAAKAKMLGHRHRQIDQVAEMLRSSSCFRRSFRAYFRSAEAARKVPIPERILNWVFGTKAARSAGVACCDYCDRERIRKDGRLIYVSSAIRLRTIR
jgi:ATP-dependent DNA helicase RecQ